jgi:hypothetical protein
MNKLTLIVLVAVIAVVGIVATLYLSNQQDRSGLFKGASTTFGRPTILSRDEAGLKVDLNLPDCPQGVAAPITGPKCIQPHFRKLPPYPDPVENNKTLAGIDSDKDGVRDDVQWAIAEMFANSERMRAGAMQYARAQQKDYAAQSAPLKAEGVLITEEASRASSCFAAMLQIRDPSLDKIDAIGEAQAALAPLVKQIKNTPERVARERQISQNMAGAAFTGEHRRGKSLESLCAFNFQYMKD